jgi:hypothetical protein
LLVGHNALDEQDRSAGGEQVDSLHRMRLQPKITHGYDYAASGSACRLDVIEFLGLLEGEMAW